MLSAHLEPGQPAKVPLYAASEAAASKPRVPAYTELPAWSAASQIEEACKRSQVVCVQGETGCGKSSVLPMIFLKDPNNNIAVTQPRRIAAISLAQRVAQTRNEAVGETVGYRVAMDGKVTPNKTRLSFVTTGWLLMYLAHRPEALQRYTHIVLDEIHERDLDMDLLCLFLKRSLPKHPKLRLILMSATVDAAQFLGYFEKAGSGSVRVEKEPIVVGSRRFPTYPYFLDDLVGGALEGFVPKVRLDKFDRVGGKVEVQYQLFEVCVGIVRAVAKPGLCVLIFLPGLSEIEQLHEAFQFGQGRCPIHIHILHSVIPHEQQKLALDPPPVGHCKVVLSTNIAESSITIPDVRYVLDYGIVRKMVFDEERAMQSLCNTWSSQATCRQRRGRCGRLQEGVIIYLFPRSLYERLDPYAAPEVLGVPLESIYLKAKVLLHHLGAPEILLSELIMSPPRDRITSAAQNLKDLGAIRQDEKVAALGRIAVLMPTTIQLTKLILVSWALGIPADGIAIAAALSTQDVFKLAAPAQCRSPEEFPTLLADNYLARAYYDAGQFSEPIMYRNLFKDYLGVSKTNQRSYYQWLDQSFVAVSRMSQFAALVTEFASRFGAAVPDAKFHPHVMKLMQLKRTAQLPEAEINELFTEDYVRLKTALVGAFQPSFVQGEINTANKNKGKFMNCGFDPMRTCLLQQIKPPEMADPDNLWEFCKSLKAPIKDLKVEGKIAYIECGDDWDVRVPHSDVVHQMPLLAQLLHQLMRQSCKFKVLTDKGIWHEPSKIGSPNCLGGMKWHVNGMRTKGSPYWRSNMGYMCEMRGELKCHWGVCSSLLGRDGPDEVRITGLTILPPPGTMSGTVMILAFLNGPFKVTFLGSEKDIGFKGVEIVATDVQARPMVLSFAPGWWTHEDMCRLNDFRMAMNDVIEAPGQDKAEAVIECYRVLMGAVEYQKTEGIGKPNQFFPDAEYDISREPQVQARLVPPPNGTYDLFEVGATKVAAAKSKQDRYEVVENEGAQERFRVNPPWLRSLSMLARADLEVDLEHLRGKFSLATASIVQIQQHGLPLGPAVEITGPRAAVEAARDELVVGIMQYYATQVEWGAIELPVDEPEPEPKVQPRRQPPPAEKPAPRTQAPVQERAPAPAAAPARGSQKGGAAPKAAAAPADTHARKWVPGKAEPAQEPDSGGWGDAPKAEVLGGWGDVAAPVAPEVDWGGGGGGTAASGAGAGAAASAWDTPEAVEGLWEVFLGAGLSEASVQAINGWAASQGAASLEELVEYADVAAHAVGIPDDELEYIKWLRKHWGF